MKAFRGRGIWSSGLCQDDKQSAITSEKQEAPIGLTLRACDFLPLAVIAVTSLTGAGSSMSAAGLHLGLVVLLSLLRPSSRSTLLAVSLRAGVDVRV